MKRNTQLEYEDASPEVRATYDEIMDTMGSPSVLNSLKALGNKKLGQGFVHIQCFNEIFGLGDKFFLTALAFFGLGHDVDGPAGQLGRQTHILSTTTNCQ